jgi:hypothetical protein
VLRAFHHRHHATDPIRSGGPRQDRHAERRQHAAVETLDNAEAHQRRDVPGGGAQHRAGREEHERYQVRPLGAEAIRRPAGQRDHRGEGERVAGHAPGHLRGRGVEVVLERRLGDGHDRDVQDRRDRSEHHHAGDQQDGLVERVAAGRGRGGGEGTAALIESLAGR